MGDEIFLGLVEVLLKTLPPIKPASGHAAMLVLLARPGREEPQDRPLDILRERYARRDQQGGV
jgi:hypothetical protein